MKDYVLKCSQLSKNFGTKAALQDVSLSLEKGRIIGLLGPNGSGKTTFLKIANGLLQPSSGELQINGKKPGVETKMVVSYLPDRTYLSDQMRVSTLIQMFTDFYEDFEANRAYDMLARLEIDPTDKLKTMSKGTKEKVQLILVMSRQADLYLLDEPIGGVDPATRDYILNTIIGNYRPESTVLISTHLITDVEKILDEVIFIANGKVVLHDSVDNLRDKEGKSIDALFREVFKC